MSSSATLPLPRPHNQQTAETKNWPFFQMPPLKKHQKSYSAEYCCRHRWCESVLDHWCLGSMVILNTNFKKKTVLFSHIRMSGEELASHLLCVCTSCVSIRSGHQHQKTSRAYLNKNELYTYSWYTRSCSCVN